MAARHVVVDGSNIATEGRSLPSLKQLDEAVRAFIKENPDDVLTIVVDATFEHRIDSSEKKMYDEALEANELITPPAGTIGRGDKFLLEIADRADAAVLSNDSFQEFHGEYTWLFDEGRLVGGKPVPGIGWIFTGRTPVRGPKSRQAVRAAGKKRSRAETSSSGKKQTASSPGHSGSGRSGSGRSGGRSSGRPDADQGGRDAARSSDGDRAQGNGGSRTRGRRGATPSTDPINDPLPFVEFIAEHPVGSTVEGEVVEFSSHGAYVLVGAARCYVPLKSMGDPAPRSAREVLNKGDTREFVVQSLDAPRRGIDLALPGFEVIEVPVEGDESAPAVTGEQLIDDPSDAVAREVAARRAATSKKAAARKARAGRTGADAGEAPAPADEVLAEPVSDAAEAAPAKKAAARKSARKAAAKQAPAARKAAAKKAAVKKAVAEKAAADEPLADEAPAAPAVKKAAVKKAAAKKAATKKSATKKAAAKKKAAVKKAPATTKAAAKKAATKKAAAKKAVTKKAAAKKATKKKAAPPAG
jgi:hypothetical protein